MVLSLPSFLQRSQNLSLVASQSNLPLDFQNSIKQGNTDHVKNLISMGEVWVNNPLPNGELPLQFAVRENRQEVVTALLEQGADPEIKDFQHLTAIDHAVLMKNENILYSIIGYKIGKDLKEIQDQIKCKGSASHVNQLKSKIQKISTVDVQGLTPICKAAYQGDLDELSKPSQNINDLDVNGFAPIHYAILNNQSAAVEKLIQLGSNVKLLTSEGDSLLHFAAISKSQEILTKLIKAGTDLNHQNSSGSTALHYASAKENLTCVETLVKAGANPYLLDAQSMSPLALIGSSAFQRDPLSLPKTHIVLFATASLYWISLIALTSGWVTSDQAQLTTALIAIGFALTASWSEFAILVTNLNKTWKKIIAWVCVLGIGSIPPINIVFNAWTTYHVARSAFEGLKKCWKNVGYRNWAVTRNVVVYGVNTAHSTRRLYDTCVATYELYLNATYWFKMFVAAHMDDKDTFFETYEEYLRFLRVRYNIGVETIDVSQCEEIKPSTLAGLSTIDRLCKAELKPQCPEHALMMISPDFTMEELSKQGMSLYKKAYRELMLNEVHPDRVGSDKKIEEAAVRLNLASDTLKKWVAQHK